MEKRRMRTREERRSDAQHTILAWLEPLLHKKVDWNSLPDDFKSRFEPYLEEMSQKPEVRMRKTMEAVASSARLRWTPASPPGHPYDAQLDGQLFHGRERIAVVELEARIPKQVRGALLDLMTYPRGKKLLIIGVSDAVIDPEEVKKQIKEQVIPVLSRKFNLSEDIGVFTERELKQAPQILGQFLAVSAA
jgi:hypothetical protein